MYLLPRVTNTVLVNADLPRSRQIITATQLHLKECLAVIAGVIWLLRDYSNGYRPVYAVPFPGASDLVSDNTCLQAWILESKLLKFP